jgi:hypothetical protein
VGLLLVLARCDWAAEPADEQSLVVQAFVEAGGSPPPVTLRRTRPLRSSGDSLEDAATGGQVRLTVDGRTVRYEESGTQPGRYVPVDNTIDVPARAPWRLTVQWDGTSAEARGVTPPPIEIAEVCVEVPDTPSRAVQVDSVRRDSLDIPADQGYLYPIEVMVKWMSLPSALSRDSAYWVRAQLRPDATPFPSEVVEFFLEPAETQREDQFPRTGRTPQWRGVYAVPVDSSDDPLPVHDLTAALVRGDTAFASFAQTRTDPDRREPLSNVDGALGVALGVAVDSLSRVIEPDVDRCVTPP